MEKGLVFGLSIGDLLAIYDHDMQSWKMSGCLFTGDYAKFSEALPKSGIMLNGRIYGQATWARRTGEKESGLWLTPSRIDIARRSDESMEKRFAYRKKIGRNGVSAGCLSEQMNWSQDGNPITYINRKMWPTPDCSDRRSIKSKQQGLSNVVKMYPTMTSNDAKNSITESQRGRGTLTASMLEENTTGQLNPQWVDWLMGYPVGWTDLEDSEMQLSLR